MPKGMRLVASTLRRGAAERSSPTSGAASSTCSKLSSTSKSSLRLTYSFRRSSSDTSPLSPRPSAPAMVVGTRAVSFTSESATKKTPSSKSSSTSAAACKARRVLPVPPGPVSVSRRTSSCPSRSHTSSTSRSLPTSGVGWSGRLLRRLSRVLKGGNSEGRSGMVIWKTRSGRKRSFRRFSPRSLRDEPAGRLSRTSSWDRQREQGLAAVPGREEPGDPVYGRTEVVASAARPPPPCAAPCGPGSRLPRPTAPRGARVGREGGPEGFRGRGEGSAEGVTDRLEDEAAVAPRWRFSGSRRGGRGRSAWPGCRAPRAWWSLLCR